MNRRTFLLGTSTSFFASSLSSYGQTEESDQTVKRSLSEIALQSIDQLVTPGIQISVWKNGMPTIEIMLGQSNLETTSKVTSSTIFRSGSITKQFTAALIAKLHDDGRLSIHDKLDKYLSFFKGKRTPSLLELIHHTAGIHDEQGDIVSLAPRSQLDLAESIARQKTLFDFAPGAAWLYSNANYILLGAVIESITKQPLASAAHELLFVPIGLEHTAFDNHMDIVKQRAAGYARTESDAIPFTNARFLPIEQAGGAGAIRSTTTDLCRWHHALFNESFLSSTTRKALVEPAKLRDGRSITKGRFIPSDKNMGEISYGYGLMLDRSTKNQGVIATHNGFISGFSGYLATHVPSKTTIACLCNTDPSPQLPFRLLRKTVFADYLQ